VIARVRAGFFQKAGFAARGSQAIFKMYFYPVNVRVEIIEEEDHEAAHAYLLPEKQNPAPGWTRGGQAWPLWHGSGCQLKR
jgi:hypothetical protein